MKHYDLEAVREAVVAVAPNSSIHLHNSPGKDHLKILGVCTVMATGYLEPPHGFRSIPVTFREKRAVIAAICSEMDRQDAEQ